MGRTAHTPSIRVIYVYRIERRFAVKRPDRTCR